MNKIKIILFFSLVALISCETNVDFEPPVFNDESILEGTENISDEIKTILEGVYRVDAGASTFGDQVVLKWARGKLSLFGERQGVYSILSTGKTDSTILFEGKWRHSVSTETGLVRLVIGSNTGFYNLDGDSLETGSFALNGGFGFESGELNERVKLTYVRSFSDKVKNSDFYILAHRGGGRNSDYVGASENSLEIIPYAEHFGAHGIEIDIKLSKDNIPFLYHDKQINLRLTKDSPIWGPIEDFTFKQLHAFVLLKNGERIPTLSEMLLYVIEETNLKFVWLDMKSEKNDMPIVIEIQRRALEIAEGMGRDIEIVIGLPSEDKLNLLLQNENYQNIPSLCELNLDDVRRVNSVVWAPRWTQGIQLNEVRQVQSEGRKAFTWTLDQTPFISEFIQEGEFDGILTNYPTIVSYFHYAQ